MISNLKEKNLLIQVSFDGRTRILKAIEPCEESSRSRGAEKCTSDMSNPTPPSYIYNKEKNDDDDREEKGASLSEKEQAIIQDESDIIIIKTNGFQERHAVSDIYRGLMRFNFKTSTIQQAIERIRQNPTPINNLLKYLESTCRQIETIANQPQKQTSRKTKTSAPKYTPLPKDENPQPTITMAEFLKKRGLKL